MAVQLTSPPSVQGLLASAPAVSWPLLRHLPCAQFRRAHSCQSTPSHCAHRCLGTHTLMDAPNPFLISCFGPCSSERNLPPYGPYPPLWVTSTAPRRPSLQHANSVSPRPADSPCVPRPPSRRDRHDRRSPAPSQPHRPNPPPRSPAPPPRAGSPSVIFRHSYNGHIVRHDVCPAHLDIAYGRLPEPVAARWHDPPATSPGIGSAGDEPRRPSVATSLHLTLGGIG